jgi:hypothetical protein
METKKTNNSTEYNKTYYQTHKEKWAEPKRIQCEACNKTVKKDHYKSQHVKTNNMHLRRVEQTEAVRKMEKLFLN